MKEKIRNFIFTNFMFDASTDDLQDDTPLLSSGIIDSIGILELVEFVQDEYGIAVEDADLVRDNFDSVNNLAAYLTSKGMVAAEVEEGALQRV